MIRKLTAFALVTSSRVIPLSWLAHHQALYHSVGNSNHDPSDGVQSLEVECETPDAIEDLGRKLADSLFTGDVLLLQGDLGAGKTTFSRGIIRAKFDDPNMTVTSPSYLLDNTYQYDTKGYIHHMDLYRLPIGCDMNILGIPDIYDKAICIIEWPDRLVDDNVPNSYLEVTLSIKEGPKQLRHIAFRPVGPDWQSRLKTLL